MCEGGGGRGEEGMVGNYCPGVRVNITLFLGGSLCR